PYNAKQVRIHLTPAILNKPVMLLDAAELVAWRDGLPAKGLKPSSINRIMKSLRAALNLAARNDKKRILNADAWDATKGMSGLPSANVPRSVFLSDAEVLDFVDKAYEVDARFGEFVEVLAQTGARPSQASRVLVRHLLHHASKPRIAMLRSGKGGAKDRLARKSETYSLPVTPHLARRLAEAAKGRRSDDVLLLQANGQPWTEHNDYRDAVRTVVQATGKDINEVT